ncbi:ABC transporter permease [Microvirga thermotolerans]|uniref:ABC transporter permease subunit n=1 Tax=Microvirga thermotolerans TaxID=2651334 RepID=A0A5P9K202_9HYPH|nr:iron ABC transporter permease [Microvirga thermotolerans]QFU16224.1 ABC transporter permease subunit [Microvirga thermotolerans]
MSTLAASHRLSATALRRALNGAPLWSVAVVTCIAALVLAPLFSLVRIAAQGEATLWAQVTADILPAALLDTGLLLGGVALLTGIVGIGAAWLVTAHRFPGHRILAALLPLPLAVPTYITAYIYVEIFDAAGPVQMALRSLMGWSSRGDYWFPEIRSVYGCVFVMSAVLYPYVYLAARLMFLTQSASMIEVARTLGASRYTLFRAIAIPLARPALAVGLSLALLESLNDIGASEYLGVRTLTVSIFTTWLNRGSLAGAAQIACVMLAIVLALIVMERRGRRDRRYALSTRRPRVTQPVDLSGRQRWLATLFCALPVVMGFVLPIAFLLREVFRRGLAEQIDEAFVGHLLTTVGLSGAATIATLAFGIVLVTASRLARLRLTKAALAIAGIGYAVPGTVLALGLLTPLVALDTSLGSLWRALTGERIGLVLMGSAGGIVIAYLIRFLPIATGSLSAGLERVSTGIEDAGRILGARPRELVLKIQIPLLRPALASAALLVFVDCIKELSATLLLRPLNTETLATLVYGHASRGAFEDGSLAALVIVLVGLAPVIQLVRSAETGPGKAGSAGSRGGTMPSFRAGAEKSAPQAPKTVSFRAPLSRPRNDMAIFPTRRSSARSAAPP